MLEKQEDKIQQVMTKYKHTHTAFVEALNKILTERLFKVQDAQKLNDPEKVSSRWAKHLYQAHSHNEANEAVASPKISKKNLPQMKNS